MGLANHRMLTRAALAAAVLIVPLGAHAQTNYAAEAARNPGAASKPTPRTADGHPDLNGVWHHFFGIGTIQKVGDSFTVGGAFSPQYRALYNTPLGDSKAPYKAAAAEKVKLLDANQVKEDPALHCMPPGVPRIGPPQPDCAPAEAGGVSVRRQHGKSVARDSAGRARPQHRSRDCVDA